MAESKMMVKETKMTRIKRTVRNIFNSVNILSQNLFHALKFGIHFIFKMAFFVLPKYVK